jgi:uroporphyrinogen-III synthase
MAVTYFFDALKEKMHLLEGKCVVAVGKTTASFLTREGFPPQFIAEDERQEGVIELLSKLGFLKNSYIFLPRSSRARPLLENFLKERKLRHRIFNLYDTILQKLLPLPDLKDFDEIVFTSPSTVEAFYEIFPEIPHGKKITAIGPVTKEAIWRRFANLPIFSIECMMK